MYCSIQFFVVIYNQLVCIVLDILKDIPKYTCIVLYNTSFTAAAESFIKYLEDISDPILVCYGICNWVSLINNLALYGYDEKLVKTVDGLLDLQTIVNYEPTLNKGLMSLVKLDTLEYLTEQVLGSEISREEFKNGTHDASLMKVFRNI